MSKSQIYSWGHSGFTRWTLLQKSLIMSRQTMAALFIDALRATDLTTFEFLCLPAKGDVAFDFVGGLLSKFKISIILMGYKLCIL